MGIALPDAVTLDWLTNARRAFPSEAGRFRVFLVALTDLPIRPAGQFAPFWNEQTWMGDGSERLFSDFPFDRHASPGYRFGVYFYEFEAPPADGEARFVSSADAMIPAVVHLEFSRLLPLR